MTAPTTWTPSLERTVAAPAGGPLPAGLSYVQAPLSWPPKASVEDLDYTLGLTAWLADAGDTAASFTIAIAPSGSAGDLAVAWQEVLAGNATVLLTGGRPGVDYVVSVEITTTAGRVALFDVGLPMTTDPVAS